MKKKLLHLYLFSIVAILVSSCSHTNISHNSSSDFSTEEVSIIEESTSEIPLGKFEKLNYIENFQLPNFSGHFESSLTGVVSDQGVYEDRFNEYNIVHCYDVLSDKEYENYQKELIDQGFEILVNADYFYAYSQNVTLTMTKGIDVCIPNTYQIEYRTALYYYKHTYDVPNGVDAYKAEQLIYNSVGYTPKTEIVSCIDITTKDFYEKTHGQMFSVSLFGDDFHVYDIVASPDSGKYNMGLYFVTDNFARMVLNRRHQLPICADFNHDDELEYLFINGRPYTTDDIVDKNGNILARFQLPFTNFFIEDYYIENDDIYLKIYYLGTLGVTKPFGIDIIVRLELDKNNMVHAYNENNEELSVCYHDIEVMYNLCERLSSGHLSFFI